MSSWTVLPRAGRPGKPPTLPAKRPAWTKLTRDWWKAIWASPMATMWREDDDELVRAALLRERVFAGDYSASLLAELRAIEDRHGLSPLARMKLRWVIETEDDGPTGPGDATVVDLRRRRGRGSRKASGDVYEPLKGEHRYDALR